MLRSTKVTSFVAVIALVCAYYLYVNLHTCALLCASEMKKAPAAIRHLVLINAYTAALSIGSLTMSLLRIMYVFSVLVRLSCDWGLVANANDVYESGAKCSTFQKYVYSELGICIATLLSVLLVACVGK